MFFHVLKLITLFGMIVSIFSCNISSEKGTLLNNNFKTDKVFRDVPKNRLTKEFISFEKKVHQLSGLNNLADAVNDVELRISYSNYDSYEYYIRITNTEGHWQSYFTKLVYVYDEKGHLVKIDKTDSPIVHNIPLDKIVDSLVTMRFMSLPDFYSNPKNKDYAMATDEKNIAFEIADKYFYRYYSYPHFFKYKGGDLDINNVYKICIFLNKHLELPVKILIPTNFKE